MFRDPLDAVPPRRDGGRLKIGVLTFHRCINYGSYWQARCLVEGLRGLGHDAVLLDHEEPEVARAELRCAFQPLLPRRSGRPDIHAYGAKTRKFQRAFAQLPLSPPFPLADPQAMGAYDLVVIGSDEVWNLTHPWYGGWPVFYGSGIPAPRVISYAASFGNYDAGAGLEPRWAEQLGNFAAISVRDFNSRTLVEGALGKEPAMVLDPCLQFPPHVEPITDEPASVIVYGHGFSDAFGEAARTWADARGHRLLSLGYRNDFAHEQALAAGPEEFAGRIAGAGAVITNFFHGCVFALLNGKPFACAGTPYRMNKVRDLTRTVGAERHLLEGEPDEAALAAVLDIPLDPAIPAAIAALRERSEAFLRMALA